MNYSHLPTHNSNYPERKNSFNLKIKKRHDKNGSMGGPSWHRSLVNTNSNLGKLTLRLNWHRRAILGAAGVSRVLYFLDTSDGKVISRAILPFSIPKRTSKQVSPNKRMSNYLKVKINPMKKRKLTINNGRKRSNQRNYMSITSNSTKPTWGTTWEK